MVRGGLGVSYGRVLSSAVSPEVFFIYHDGDGDIGCGGITRIISGLVNR